MSRLAIAVVLSALCCARWAGAQQADDVSREASKHFRRGVELYAESDYASALVEFKRALALSPNSSTLYNVGETQFQLQDYAGALTTFKRFLAEAGPGDHHRAEVENDVRLLSTRVGHMRIVTVPQGADVTVDDVLVGKTPLDESLLVSVGRRRVSASVSGRPPVTRYVDVAADDDLAVTLQLPPPAEQSPSAPTTPLVQSMAAGAAAPRTSHAGLRTAAWVTTGILAGGAATFGVLALDASRDLQRARSAFPATSSTLNHDSTLITTYSILADSLAATAVVVGGVALYWTLSSHAAAPERGELPTRRLAIGPTSAAFEMTF
ncbi:MAG TPA: PEGA domain-containing protein [Polyangiaceae bacterium]|nr:PEGA domain-containing protein [Polyangiaceae bacterium]